MTKDVRVTIEFTADEPAYKDLSDAIGLLYKALQSMDDKLHEGEKKCPILS